MAKATKLPSGKWRCKAYYTDISGKYTSKSFTADTKKEAEYRAAEFRMEMEHKKKPENKSIGELVDRYIENRAHVLAPSTTREYKKLRNSAFPAIMEVRAGYLTTQMYQAAINEYATTRKAKTVHIAHGLMKQVFEENHVDVDFKSLILPQKTKAKILVPTTEEVRLILDQSVKKGIHLPVLFAALLGLRRSEIFALKWEDIDLQRKVVRIDKAVVQDEYGQYVEKTTKTKAGTRTIRLPNQLLEALKERYTQNNKKLFDLSVDAFSSRYKRMIKKLDLPYNFHCLRHYNASIMLQNNIPNKYAMERMGHATDNMLRNVYQHTFDNIHEEYDNVLEEFWDKNKI